MEETIMTVMLSDTEVAALAAAKVADARGTACPGPLLEAKRAMGGIAAGQVLELWSSDPQTKTDVAAWAAKVGHEFLGVAPAQGYERIFIRRGK
jgi:tRNA 2-thiouridine synthesizing protein A